MNHKPKLAIKVHSFESFGSVDGPGIRFMVFVQGCAMRCAYCHNPDTWNRQGGEEWEVADILDRAERYREYWGKEGGITVSGGEALLQAQAVAELFEEAHRRGINTCLDTSGFIPAASDEGGSLERLLAATDTVLLDIKHIDPVRHKALTGQDNAGILALARRLSDLGIKTWIRHVLVPGYTDDEPSLRALADFVRTLTNIERIEVLPYHTMGKYKWQKLGIPYRLEGVEPPTQESVERAEQILREGVSC
ncbi:MAG: pyruvate formate lyase-activating protein [Bacteroidaceae bacterium]|nr:pyruvate formate lyase-activating protein [Bacteroidaceae bacterium]